MASRTAAYAIAGVASAKKAELGRGPEAVGRSSEGAIALDIVGRVDVGTSIVLRDHPVLGAKITTRVSITAGMDAVQSTPA